LQHLRRPSAKGLDGRPISPGDSERIGQSLTERNTTMSTSNKKPINIKDGNIKATIWTNESDKGTFYSVSITRTFRDDTGYHDATSFRAIELLKVSRIAGLAYDRVRELQSQRGDDGENGDTPHEQ
jgi:hypothetical protein